MRRLLLFLFVVGATSFVWAATPIFITPDIPTDETIGGSTLLQDEVLKYTGVAFFLQPLGALPANTHLDAIHKLDKPGDWLFSVESATDFPGFTAEARDVVRYTSSTGTYSLFFCGGTLGADPVPAGSNVDAIYLDGHDGSDLIVSFDVHTTIPGGGMDFEPADLVRYTPTGGGTCIDWALGAGNPELDASTAGAGVPPESNVVGADKVGPDYVLAFDVPSDVAPPAFTFLPGEIGSFSAGAWALYETVGGWPGNLSSFVDGLSCLANPGRVPTTITVDKSTTAGNIVVSWSASCSDAEDYAIYEGTIGTWYSHTLKLCTDTGGDFTEDFTPTAPASTSRYYLVVPLNPKEGEGSYGFDSAGAERPVGSAQCVTPQLLTPCPP